MKVLITGTSGRVGSRLASLMRHSGWLVRGLDLEPSPPTAVDEMVVGDLSELSQIERALVGVDYVVHLAAFMSWLPADTESLFRINVTGTYNLMRGIQAANVRRVVFASSGEVYPEVYPEQNPPVLPFTETHPTMPTSAYGMTKLLGEHIVRNISTQANTEHCIVRFAHTQIASELLDPDSFFSGPRFFVASKLRQLRSLPRTEPVAKSIAALEAVATGRRDQLYIGCSPDGTPYRMAICDARDMAQGLSLCLTQERAASGVFNIGPASSIDFAKGVRYIGELLGQDVPKVRLATTGYRYDTSIARAVEAIGYSPQYDFFAMVDEAFGSVETR